MSNPHQALPEGLERRHDPLGLMAATDDASMDEVKAGILANDEHRETMRKLEKAIQAFSRQVHHFSAQGLTPRKAKRAAAKRMGLTTKAVNQMIENYHQIRELLGITEGR